MIRSNSSAPPRSKSNSKSSKKMCALERTKNSSGVPDQVVRKLLEGQDAAVIEELYAPVALKHAGNVETPIMRHSVRFLVKLAC